MNLNQVTLPSTDVERAARFYRELGFVQIVDSVPRYARFECPDGGATFSLHQVDELPGGPGAVLYFECSDLDKQYQALVDRGVRFESPPVDQPWLWREAYLRDPDGNLLCLYFAGENRRFPPWRVDAGDRNGSRKGAEDGRNSGLKETGAMEPRETPHGQVAFLFASQLVAGEFDGAHRMLSATAKRDWPADLLESTYRGMVEYFESPPNLVIVVNTMEDWPDKRPNDVGWAYAAIAGEDGSEAVTVVVCDEGGHHAIRSIEWGRP